MTIRMRAIIKAGGKQYIVEKDQVIDLELLPTSDKKQIEFEVLMLIDGDKVQVGTPTLENVKVTAEILGESKGQKIKVLKFKPKKRYKKLTGHRQRYSQVKITSI